MQLATNGSDKFESGAHTCSGCATRCPVCEVCGFIYLVFEIPKNLLIEEKYLFNGFSKDLCNPVYHRRFK